MIVFAYILIGFALGLLFAVFFGHCPGCPKHPCNKR